MNPLASQQKEIIRQKALELGFSQLGFAKARELDEHRETFSHWLNEGMNGGMAYLSNHFEKRLDPAKLVEGTQSVLVTTVNYFPEEVPASSFIPIIAKYAYGLDYHVVIREKLKMLLAFIQQQIAFCNGRVFVDSAPIFERQWAVEAGLGWIGKNSLLISREHGSFLFIGILLIDLPIEPDLPFIKNHCGNCKACMETCPTQAILAPGIVDSRKCLSYHTIENKEDIPHSISSKLGNRLFGCDQCQDVCPWNRKCKPTPIEEFRPLPGLLSMTKTDWLQLTPGDYKAKFRNSSLERAGLRRLQKNVHLLDE